MKTTEPIDSPTPTRLRTGRVVTGASGRPRSVSSYMTAWDDGAEQPGSAESRAGTRPRPRTPVTVDTDQTPTNRERPSPPPPLPIRVLGQTISRIVAHAPALWPVLRGPTRRFWERSAGTWEERIDPDRPDHLAPLAAACDRLPAAPERVLELGTGTGAGARMLAERFPEAQVDAIDLSPSMVEAARERSAGVGDRARFAVGDAATLPFDEQTFDLVVQLNMPVFPGQIARVLRPGGHVIVASSLGAATPYYTPERLLRRRFAKLGFVDDAIAQTVPGTFFLARRADGSPADDALRRFYDKSAGRYDRQISFFERVLFAGGREWVCSQAEGDVLELAVGTGRNLRHYAPTVRVTGIEYSPGMLELAR